MSEGEALINTLREEMEKNSQLREKLSAKEQLVSSLEREKRDLERNLERSNQDQQHTLQMMDNLQASHKEQAEVFLQRITFLESKIAPCEEEAAQAAALRAQLERKEQECADLDEALRELEQQMELASQTALESAQVHYESEMNEMQRLWDKERKELEQQVHSAHQHLLRLEDEEDRWQDMVRAKDEEIVMLKAQLDELSYTDGIKEEVLDFLIGPPSHVDLAGGLLCAESRPAGRLFSAAETRGCVRGRGGGLAGKGGKRKSRLTLS